MANSKRRGKLVLKDGTVLEGESFGADVAIVGECVFQTGMVGYPEAFTDPSYRGQILVLTYPLVGNYGVPDDSCYEESLAGVLKYFESSQIHISGLIVSEYSQIASHYLSKSTISQWLAKNNVPALSGIDTRFLTKKLRQNGSIVGKLICDSSVLESSLTFSDPNNLNLVSQVSRSVVTKFGDYDDRGNLRILAIDVGLKNNQLRCLAARGASIKVVPWNYDFSADTDFDGIFISNGPGDPVVCRETVDILKKYLTKGSKPVFGICLGHQLLALAIGAKTKKLPYGNRGLNIPCTDLKTGKCYITSQNHGYAVDSSTLPSDWEEWFINANDLSNEGIMHKSKPFFSVQFHPESCAGPKDTEFLFDTFIDCVKESKNGSGKFSSLRYSNPIQPKRISCKKVLILGSGGLSIGQAGEFDYSGSQAIKALKEEGIYTILINPNIATIQTSKGLADKVYFLPVNPEFVRKVIQAEQPDGIYVTFGGQTALNVGVKMKDEFASLGVKVLGTPIDAIIATEDRDIFARKLEEINEKIAKSKSAATIEEAKIAAKNIGYPIICRAAYALGGLGSGFAEDEKQLVELCTKAFKVAPQVLIERSMKGWKEIEYEVVRDAYANCITVCNMENFDPLGIHTGDSIVVAPSQTLSDKDYNMLRSTAIKVVQHLGVVGECNIQYALNPDSDEYCIIEVNARLSRSSALASKATGYPLAFVAAKLGLGIPLNEIKNSVTKVTVACFEPSLDYLVVKIPRWDLKKFNHVSTKISSAMKSVGEVMAIGRSFEETIQKAIRAVDFASNGFCRNNQITNVIEELKNPSDMRLFAIANALHDGMSIEKIWEYTKIDRWFLSKLENIVKHEKLLHSLSGGTNLPREILLHSKRIGFSDKQIGLVVGSTEMAIRQHRVDEGIYPCIKQIDTGLEVVLSLIGVLFAQFGTLRKNGFKTIMVNYNPETVSTDYDEADRLYFENITLETILDIYSLENAAGVIVSMGGQTPNNIALPLMRKNVKILGTSPDKIDNAENRYKFSRMCDKIGIDQPKWKELTHINEAKEFCCNVGYPVLVRPSYVLSGAAMNVVHSEEDLENYLKQAVAVSNEFPVVISKFIEEAKEIEVDAVALNGKLLIHVISEHVENAGVHSGDATLVQPPQDLDPETVEKIEIATSKIADSLNVTGPFNIQFIAKNNEIKIIECNLRASRSFPFVSKVLNIDLIEMATLAMMGLPVQAYPELKIPKNYVGVKVPQFSFSRLSGADPILGVEMASTGEVACFGADKYEAYLKALIGTGFSVPEKNILLSIGSFKEKKEFLPSVKRLHECNYSLFATPGTADFYLEHGIPVKILEYMETNDPSKKEYNLTEYLSNNLIDLYINLPSKNKFRRPANYMSKGYRTRRMAVDLAIPLISNIKCAKLFIEAICRKYSFSITEIDFKTTHKLVTFPGFLDIYSEWDEAKGIKFGLSSPVTSGISFSGIVSNHQVSHGMKFSNFMPYGRVGETLLESSMSVYMTTPLEPLDKLYGHMQSWVNPWPMVVELSGSELATVLYFVSLYGTPVHFTQVKTKCDLQLILMAKMKHLPVTCDVAVYNLFLSLDDTNGGRQGMERFLARRQDVEFLWENLECIDCLTSGKLISALEDKNTLLLDYSEIIGLLLTCVEDGRILYSELLNMIHENPKRIFHLNVSPGTLVTVEIDRPFVHSTGYNGNRSACFEHCTFGYVDKVVLEGKEVLYDGKSVPVDGSLQKRMQNLPALESLLPIKKAEVLGNANTGADDNLEARKVKAAVSILVPPKSPGVRAIGSIQQEKQNFLVQIESGQLQSPFHGQSILTSKQFKRANLHMLYGLAQELRDQVEKGVSLSLMKGKVMASLFFEPSTRTSTSFETAMLRLGGNVVKVDHLNSSMAKGETLEDMAQTLSVYCNLLVIRHPKPGSVSTAAKISTVPVINGGDGAGEHPTQALLDVFTIREELGTVNGLNIVLVGDLKNGRTVHSLVRLLTLYDVKLHYVSPPSLRMPAEIVEELKNAGVSQTEYSDLERVLPFADVLYVTRIQKERFDSLNEYNAVAHSFVINAESLSKLKTNMIIMHPLPRNDEISKEVDLDPRACYFRQMRYGLFVRMALIYSILKS